ncbi:MAG TPA: substrate-binding domain-containing protein [Candidatus Binataceae bacterium]|nr:substrate-binding domain-containing protein [Candidatus Binataceae bacterium]
MSSIRSGDTVQRARLEKGLSQSELARRAAISRQALSAIEAGAYQPSVTVAIRLARILGHSVENLFGDNGSNTVTATFVGDESCRAVKHQRVALARVGGRVIAVPRAATALSLTPVAGIVECPAAAGGTVQVKAFHSAAEIDSALVMVGCDPAVSLLSEAMARQSPPIRVIPIPRPSLAALSALAAGKAHVAGIHIRDPQSGEYNLQAAHRAMRRRPYLMVNFARWELGLAVAPGNPHAIRAVADLARPRIRIVNREPGSGARLALDEAIAASKLRPAAIAGYQRELGGHLEVAAAIADGAADTGMTLRVAAEAYGLGFIAMREERYDLVIPEAELQSIPVRAMLDTLNSSRFANELSLLCAYETSQMGSAYQRA